MREQVRHIIDRGPVPTVCGNGLMTPRSHLHVRAAWRSILHVVDPRRMEMEETRREMIARLEREVSEIEPEAFVWSDPGPVLLERALGELGFDWNELEDIPQQHVHLGIPIRQYPKTDLVYARAGELQNAIERKEEEIVRHHLHSWAIEAHVEEGIWEDNAMWLNVRHVPDPVSYYLHEKEWRDFVADVERAMASPGERFVGGRIKDEESDQDSDNSGWWS